MKARSLVAGLAVAALAVTACSGPSTTTSTGGPAGAAVATGSADDLASVCPTPDAGQHPRPTINIVMSWWPESTHGGLYNLFGPNPVIDKNKKRITGPLVIDGKDTGVDLQLRTGGPGASYQQAPQLLYTDRTNMLGQAATEEQIGASAKQPTLAVFAPMVQDPLVYIFDPATYPNFNSISDIGQTDTKVVSIAGPNTAYLTGTGILRATQMDLSYDGTPQRFVSARGKVVVGGFAPNEPYIYAHLPQWGKPVKYLYVSETGYPDYRNEIIIRAGDKAAYAPCLTRLVPILQRGQAEFLRNPKPALDLIVKTVAAYNPGYSYTADLALAGWKVQRDDALVADDPHLSYLGPFVDSRLQRMIDILTPIYVGQKQPVDQALTPAKLATNEFLDHSIKVAA